MTETSPPTVPDSASGETSLPPVSDENGANRPSLNQSPSTPTSDQKEVVNDPNPYDYLNRNEFTSERFKVEMRKLPRQLGVKQIKKKMATLGITAHKVKILHWGAYVTFMSEEERDKAIREMNGLVWKSNTLEVSIAKPRADPGLVAAAKRHAGFESRSRGEKKARKEVEEEEGLSAFERLKRAVSPLADMPYEDQLKSKVEAMRVLLLTYRNKILKLNPLLEDHLISVKDESSGNTLLCPLNPIKASPVLERYRNKCEFTVGRDLDGNVRVVGFRIGKHKGGHNYVGSPEALTIISPPIEAVRRALQTFLQEKFTKFEAHDTMTYSGHWRSATVRSTRNGDTMLALDFVADSWDDPEPTEAREALIEYFSSENLIHLQLRSLHFIARRRPGDAMTAHNCRVIHGDSTITEECLDLKFRISLGAFFQVNTTAAEVLYSLVRSCAQVSDDVTLLDLCCGTGTIGLCVAKSVRKIVGIEMCAEAIEDAKENAKRNEISNASFVCGRVEDALPAVMAELEPREDVVVILDPPRAGVHSSVIAALRKCPLVRSIIFVSCNPEAAAASNFLDLTRPESNRVRGVPFVPVTATPVDLFPQTRHVELVTAWRRIQSAATSEENIEKME